MICRAVPVWVVAVSWLQLVLADVSVYEVSVNQSLYYGSQGWPSGALTYKAGFYGGPVEVQHHGMEENLTAVSMDCFLTSPRLVREDFLLTRGMSYDPINDNLLLHLYDQRRTSVFVLPRCVGPHMCSYNTIKHTEDLQASAVFSYATTSDRSEACPTALQPFAVYARKVYFVAKRLLTIGHEEVLKLELRQMGCSHDLFHSQNPFNINKCSELIAVLYESSSSSCEEINTAHHLYIAPEPSTPGVTSDGQEEPSLTFFVQVFVRTAHDFSVALFMASKRLGSHQVASNPLPYSYHEYTDTGRHLGGIDYHSSSGKLCWSAVTSILCGTWLGGAELRDIETVLPPYAAAAAGACYVGAGGPEDLANFTTGVAIAQVDADAGIAVYFGCEQEQPEWGGAGMLRLLPDTGAPVIFPLRQNNNKIHSGFMFLADTCDPNSCAGLQVGYHGLIMVLVLPALMM